MMTSHKTGTDPQAIAVLGLACRFPGARSADEFWGNLRSGVESIRVFSEEELRAAGVAPEQIRDPRSVPAKGVLDEADCFDAAFFGLSPREAAIMDPQQRVFLECAWAALEDAGYETGSYRGAVGVFAGSILSMYLLQNVWPNRQVVTAAGSFQAAVGNDPTFLATGTSYHLDLRGPSVSVGTACSTSLVAVHLACQSLLAHESDMALAGGVSVHLPLVGAYRAEEGGILSPDGHCRPFDAAARGTVSSDGVGVVVLKRLDEAIADGDAIRAIIRGSAINNDGRLKVGYTAPSAEGEARVIAEALAVGGVEPETVSMVETHGAGTILGDPIEVAALVEAFGECAGRRGFCALGSVKSNIGHVDAAAGIAGFIKAVLAVQHREIPPTLNYHTANPQIDFRKTPFYVNDRLRTARPDQRPLRAGVSSFGIGGTNAHVVLEEPPTPQPAPSPDQPPRSCDLLMLSARTGPALELATDRLADHLERAGGLDLGDVCSTLRRGRRSFEHRRALVCRNREDAIAALRTRDARALMTAVAPCEKPLVAFMFPGLGDHYPGMGWEFYYTEPQFRRTIDCCAELLRPHLETDIRDFLYPGRDWSRPVLEGTADAGADPSKLDLRAMLGRGNGARTRDPASDPPALGQPAIFVTEVALAELLRHWGIEPAAMIGHSIGEFSAAYLSGVLSLPDAIELVATRARLIKSRVEPGAMLAVPLSECELTALLPAGVSLGAVNGVNLCIASGVAGAVAELETILHARGVGCQRLRSTHAYHSAMMETIVEPLLAVLERITLRAPRIPYISCVTGTWIADDQATDPTYWSQHLCRTVRFQEGLSRLLEDSGRILLEVGPGQGLTSHALGERSRVAGRQNAVIPTMRWSYGLQSEQAILLRAVGRLWLEGASIDTARFLEVEGRGRRRVHLPTYPFERKRHWIAPPTSAEPPVSDAPARKKPDVADWFYLPFWKPSVLPWRGLDDDKGGGNWLVFVDAYGVGTDLAERLRARGERVVTVEPGTGFRCAGDASTLDPRRGDDFDALMSELAARGQIPGTVVHLWCLTPDDRRSPSEARFDSLQDLGYYSVVRLFQALFRRGLERTLRLDVVTNHVCDVTGAEPLVPEKATLRAPAMVGPQEHPIVISRCIDTDIPPDDRGRRDLLLAQILDEIRGEPANLVVAYRDGRRWLPSYEPVRLWPVAGERSPFRRRGVYLLTGGLGGVGLVLARHLARTAQARLVLVGRSAFPERHRWADWLAGHPEGDRTSGKIRQLQAIEELGSEVLVLAADVADRESMGRALRVVDERFGELHGIIHGAGAVGVETFHEISQATTSDAEVQFAAKVRGLMVLDQLLAARPLDFVVLLSSLSAVLGGLGFCAYSAANLFMDAFARRKNRAGGTRWTSVDWESWRLPDVDPVIAGLGATVSEFAMEPEEGSDACERILAERNLSQVVVSSGDLASRLRQWVDRDGWSDSQPRSVTLHERPNLMIPYQAPRGELEREIAEIWQELFGITSLGVHDNFFELGGHSLLATQLNARLSARLHVELSLATVLQAPTIAELALAVVRTYAEDTDTDELEKILAQFGQ